MRSNINSSPADCRLPHLGASDLWEVLKGVGVDGAGGNLPFFFAFMRFSSLFFCGNLPFFALFFAFLCFILEQGANDCNLLENGGFHSDPFSTDPVENFPMICGGRSDSVIPSQSRCSLLLNLLFFFLIVTYISVAQEPNQNQKPEPSQPFLRNRNQNRNRAPLSNSVEAQKRLLSGGSEPKTGTVRTGLCTNRNRTEPGLPCYMPKSLAISNPTR